MQRKLLRLILNICLVEKGASVESTGAWNKVTTDLLSGPREKLACSSFCKGFQMSSSWNKQMTVLMKSVFPKSV